MSSRKYVRALALFAGAALCVSLAQQMVWAPKREDAGRYTAPHKPHTKLAELKAQHKGEANWRVVVADDELLHAEFISAAPGTKVSPRFHPDTRAWWVVLEGQIQFQIEGQKPFVASKNGMVQVPRQTLYSMEVVGDRPALRLEAGIARAKTLYPKDATPPTLPGFKFVQVMMDRKPARYENGNKPHTTFEELAAQAKYDSEGLFVQPVVKDDRAAANFIYGFEKNLRPVKPNDHGHFHPDSSEFWLILAGQIRYPIEGHGVVIADPGDLVYVPPMTYHFPRFHGPGPSCRLAMNGYPEIAHLFDPAH